jgi:two-component system sensor histidine kinase RegB
MTTVEQKRLQPLSEFVEQTVSRWAVRRPGVVHRVTCDSRDTPPLLACESTLAQAFENLLNNAADSGSERVAVDYRWNDREARIAVRDWGEGFSAELLQDIGKPIIRASRSGLGIGLLLSHATVERYGGRIELSNVSAGGAEAVLFLPLPAGEEAA